MTVGEYVAQASAFARVELGMRRDEFLALSPREWNAIEKAWEQREARQDRRTARICMVLAWCHGVPQATEGDFIPVPVAEDEPDPQEILAQFRAATAGFQHNGRQ